MYSCDFHGDEADNLWKTGSALSNERSSRRITRKKKPEHARRTQEDAGTKPRRGQPGTYRLYAITPTPNTSWFFPYPVRRKTSGAAYPGVPATSVSVFGSSSEGWSRICEASERKRSEVVGP